MSDSGSRSDARTCSSILRIESLSGPNCRAISGSLRLLRVGTGEPAQSAGFPNLPKASAG
jgi:hypothetical protein